jgi:hypothetical protein
LDRKRVDRARNVDVSKNQWSELGMGVRSIFGGAFGLIVMLNLEDDDVMQN